MDKKKVNPIEFIEKYNSVYNKSFVFKSDIKRKKSVSLKTLIKSFVPMLYNDYKKTKKGGELNPPATDTIENVVQRENLNNFFNYFPRNPEFTSVYNKVDLTTNQTGNEFPAMSTYSRGNF